MAEVEHRPDARFALVLLDNPRLEAAALRDYMREYVRSQASDFRGVVLDEAKQSCIADCGGLDDLGHAVVEVARRQRSQRLRVRQDRDGLMERPEQVFPFPEVDAGLAADARIHLRDKGGWYLNVVHPSHVGGGQEAGDIADHPSAECRDDVPPLHSCTEQPPRERFNRPEGLAALTGGYCEGFHLQPLARQRPADARAVKPRDVSVGDDGAPPVEIRQFNPQRQQPRLDARLVGMPPQSYVNDFHCGQNARAEGRELFRRCDIREGMTDVLR